MRPCRMEVFGVVARRREGKSKTGQATFSFNLQVLGGELYCQCSQQQYGTINDGSEIAAVGGLKFFEGKLGFDLQQLQVVGDGQLAPPAGQGMQPPRARAA